MVLYHGGTLTAGSDSEPGLWVTDDRAAAASYAARDHEGTVHRVMVGAGRIVTLSDAAALLGEDLVTVCDGRPGNIATAGRADRLKEQGVAAVYFECGDADDRDVEHRSWWVIGEWWALALAATP